VTHFEFKRAARTAKEGYRYTQQEIIAAYTGIGDQWNGKSG